MQKYSMCQRKTKKQVAGNSNSSYWCVLKPSANIPRVQTTPGKLCVWGAPAGSSQKSSHGACSALLWHNLLWVSSASSHPGALHNNCTSYHIIHCPVVLKEQKCDEGWEKEGNREVFVQGSNSWSVKRDRDSGCKKKMWSWDWLPLLWNLWRTTFNINYSRRQRDVSCWHDKHPVRLDQHWRVTWNNPESYEKFPWSGSSCSPDAHDLKRERHRSCYLSAFQQFKYKELRDHVEITSTLAHLIKTH